MDGFLVVDKPTGMTSRAVVNRIQRLLPRKTKIGHTGTLDPLATGVLVLCIGKATKLADTVQAMGKKYFSDIRLDATSNTCDADGEVVNLENAKPISKEQIEGILPSFLGIVQQMPPIFSALKVAGRRSHELARQGIDVQLTARPIRIDEIKITQFDWPILSVEISCGKGTYIRSIARDIGEKCGGVSSGVGGMVQTLRRLSVGPFQAENGLILRDDLTTEDVTSRLRPISEVT